jgi:hypothetical protein
MLRHQNKIRITPKEKQSLDSLAGYRQAAPTTVHEFNRRLEAAAELWAAGDTAEEKLASQLARDLMLSSAVEGGELHRSEADSAPRE